MTQASERIDLRMVSGTTRAQRAVVSRVEHARRLAAALELAATHGGVLTRAMLLDDGMTTGQIRSEVERGAFQRLGRHTLGLTGRELTEAATWWRALWESGPRAVLDGPTALLAAGLRGWIEPVIHVSVPHNTAPRSIPGVQHRQLRDLGAVAGAGLRHTKPHVAVIRAAQWAATDKAAATLIAMTVQQRLVMPATLLAHWHSVIYSARRPVLDGVIRDVCDGAHSLNELDFAARCRRRRLPEPTRQAVRVSDNGRVYLDALFEPEGVHVEIQGAGHFEGTAGVADALRFNGLAIREPGVVRLQIPVLGLRTDPDAFMDQVAAALAASRKRAS
ncbi:hypothetical protein [Propioniciclava soli]|uniref:DUF559 domain-containing protein n=1 Tax=Propioniciclava soli TaxID=2775081 RepID=A0ABZ3C6H5_9ACTN|nr:hypothetical protein [Propioniciclava soli]